MQKAQNLIFPQMPTGNCNTIDVIFPASPIFLYLSPEYLSLVLKPIFRYHQSGMYLPEPAIHDLGDHYPNVTGHNEYLYPNLPIEGENCMIPYVSHILD